MVCVMVRWYAMVCVGGYVRSGDGVIACVMIDVGFRVVLCA